MKRDVPRPRHSGDGAVSEVDCKRAQAITAAAAVKKFVGLISLDVDLDHTRSLQLRDKGITVLPPHLGSLLPSVRKLDFSHNAITDLSPLATLAQLSNLTLTHNVQLQKMAGLNAKHLVVLNVANCALVSLRGLEASAQTLRTLIANDNNLRLCSPVAEQFAAGDKAADAVTAQENYGVLQSLLRCETIVLSRNVQLCGLLDVKVADASRGSSQGQDQGPEFETSEMTRAESGTVESNKHVVREQQVALAEQHPLSVFGKLPELKKLSLSGCRIDSLPARWFLPKVTELRLAHNALRSLQPEGVIVRSLKILDVSDNKIGTLSTLRRCHFLQQLHIRGNPLMTQYAAAAAEEGGELHLVARRRQCNLPPTLHRTLRRLFTHLVSVDGQTLSPTKRTRDEARDDEDEDTCAEEDRDAAAGVIVPDANAVKNSHRSEGVDVGDAPHAMLLQRSLHDIIREEKERADVLLSPPVAPARSTATPIVRRDRALRPASAHTSSNKTAVLSGSDAVARLLKQKHANDTW